MKIINPLDNFAAAAPIAADVDFEPEKPHPLSLQHAIRRNLKPNAPRFVIPGVLVEGMVCFGAYAAAGKSTVVGTLGLAVTGLLNGKIDDRLMPKWARPVIWITEDVLQATLMLESVAEHYLVDPDEVFRLIHVIPANRMQIEEVIPVAAEFESLAYESPTGLLVYPLVVWDTKSAVFSMEDENQSEGTSNIWSVLKNGALSNLNHLVVMHTAKTQKNQSDASQMTLRGSGAAEADAQQVMFLTIKNGQRFVEISSAAGGKTRFEEALHSIEVRSIVKEVETVDEYDGAKITQSVRFATLRPLSESERDGCDVQTICDGLADRATYQRIREICNLLQRHKDEGNMPLGARTAADHIASQISLATPKSKIGRNAIQTLLENDVLNLGLITIPTMDSETRAHFKDRFGSSPAPAQLFWVRLNKGWRQLLDEADPDAKEADYEV